jgi:hypothetical protein
MKSFREFILEEADDRIDGLPIGRELFKQQFISTGFLNKEANEIIVHDLKDRYIIVGVISRFSNQHVNDFDINPIVNLGKYGHGFENQANAKDTVKKLNKQFSLFNKQGDAKKSGEFEIVLGANLNKAIDKLKSKKNISSTFSLMYA